MTSPITVVTGANSGIGRATAIHLAVNGHRVFDTVRAKAEKLLAAAAEHGVEIELAELDVADDTSVERGFADILERAGRVDHLVNNAGVGGNGVVEECSSEQFLDVMNVDLVGAIRCSRAVLPQMRERGSGTIVNVTSVAGRFGAMAQAPYVASKWALEGVSEEMALELAAFGIRVAIVEPGVTKSSIFAKNIDAPNNTGAYDAHYRRMFQMYSAGIQNATDAVEVAEVIRHAIETDEPELRYLVSWGAAEMVAGRDAMSAADWVGLGSIADDAGYARRFSELMGIDITGV
ncbi:MAG: SDR family oxidoreductase [Ilumatobacteraceae bacterium]